MKTKFWLMRLGALAFLIACAFTALAQTNAPAGSAASSAMTGTGWLQLLITPATLVAAYGLRKLVPKIHREALPFIVPFLGAAISAATSQLGVWQSQGIAVDSVAGAALGGLATWVHQLGKQSGVIPETPPSDVVPPKTGS